MNYYNNEKQLYSSHDLADTRYDYIKAVTLVF